MSPDNTLPESSPSSPGRAGHIDLLNEQVVSFRELASRLPRRRMGRPTHVTTIHRWRSRGIKGIRLAAVRLGGAWVTTLQAYQRFCAALTTKATGQDRETETKQGRNHEEINRQLDDLGI
jgi:hypothetical protein